MTSLIYASGGATAPLVASLYAWQDYLLASLVIGALVFWLVIEFLGVLRAVGRFLGRMSNRAPASAQEAAQRVTEQAYAATRNDRQRRN